ncbi:MAG: filamentous hemagglutinin N-terminal domain-containing protein [Cyanobacteria bacterium J06634_6]
MGKTVANLVLRATNQPARIVGLSLLLSIGLPDKEATAQVVPTAAGTGTTVETVGDRIDIGGGQFSSNQDNLFHSFEQFDITANQTANFETIPGVQNVFGRINDVAPSVIDGTLQVSGSSANLYLINPAGILMGPNVGLNLSGGFTATTATSIGFENGQLNAETYGYDSLAGAPETFYFNQEETGSIVNLGELQVDDEAFINLIGNTVINAGSISAPEGTITLAAVEKDQWVRLGYENQLLSLEVQVSNAALLNSADAADSELSSLLTGSDLSHATTLLTDSNGNIRLGGTEITEESGSVFAQGQLSVAGEVGGSVNILGEHITLTDISIDASGNSGGGSIRVGGDYQGGGTFHTADHTVVDNRSTLRADANIQGNGGNVIVWSDDSTEFYGHVSAQGGSTGGDGGFAEVSGKRSLVMAGSADLSAQQGDFGTLLLDPDNVEITDGVFEDTNALQLSSSYVENLFNTTNLEISAPGDIRIHDIDSNTLTVEPNRAVVFRADADEDNNGAFMMDESISIVTEGGAVSIFGAGIEAGRIETATPDGSDGGDVTLSSSQGITVEAINTSSSVSKNSAGIAGRISLVADGGDIIATGDIEAQSEAPKNNADSGGNIRLDASGNIIV